MKNNIVFISIGANLGDAVGQVKQAIEALNKLETTHLMSVSSLYRTEPIDSSGDDYVNAVVQLQTEKEPFDLLKQLQQIENNFGRERPFRNAPRTLDLDILLYNDLCLSHKDLLIPHPRMTQRAFVLVPLAEIAPNIQIPGCSDKLDRLIQSTKQQRINKI